MCGIVGLISKTNKMPFHADDLFTEMLQMDTIRGEDATGVFGVTKDGKVDLMKGDTTGWVFTSTSNYAKFRSAIYERYLIAIGHNRKATTGKSTPHNAHPFKEKHIVLVHNGTIHNASTLNAAVEVDSHAIAHALAEHDCVTALGKIDGAFALVWFDQKDKTLNLARNTERPLYLVEYDDMWAIASEIGLPAWLQGREGRKHISYKLIPTNAILVFNLEQLAKGPFEVPYEAYKTWVVPSYQHHSYPDNSVTTPTMPSKLGALKTLMKSKAIAQGDEIKFQLVDYKTEAPNEVLIGHPLFDNEVDTNIVIRAVLPLGVTADTFIDSPNSTFTSRCQHWRSLGGIPVIFVTDVKPLELITDISGKTEEIKNIAQAIMQGCGRCKGTITIADVSESIVRKKNDGTWRLLCKTCLTDSRSRAAHPQIQLVQ